MEDDKLKELFSDFRPDLSPDSSFMARLQDSLDKVELVKEHNRELQHRSRLAVVIAALAGFITGVLFMILMPYGDSLLKGLQDILPQPFTVFDSRILFWVIAAFMTMTSALSAYDITLSRIRHNKSGI